MNRSNVSSFLPQRAEFYEERPITTFVVKVASRCNLKCSYCYMYEHPDQSWKEQPNFISPKTVSKLASRLVEYVKERNLSKILVIAHGGEPLLLGTKRLRDFFYTIRTDLKTTGVDVIFGIQTNAILVTDEVVELLQEYDISAGVSLDGPKDFNDKMRKDSSGEGTFLRVMEGVKKLQNPKSGKPVFGGFLSVANPELNPIETLHFFDSIGAGSVDFLLPDFNFNTYPKSIYENGKFGKWMSELFDIWFYSGSNIEIRTFKVLMQLILGGKRGYDAFGAYSNGVIVIETDGTYHALDNLKTAYHGATRTGFSLDSRSIREMEKLPLVMALSAKKFSVANKCIECDLVDVCGGGYLPHRYDSHDGFNRESIYCEDLELLIKHIMDCLSQELPKSDIS